MKPPILIVCLIALTHRAGAQLPALPDQEINYSEVHSYVSNPPEIDYEWIHYEVYPTGSGDTLLLQMSGNELGELYATDTQVWFRRTGMASPFYTFPNFVQGDWYLLYDYALQPGDTAYINDDPQLPAIVDSVTITYDYSYASPPFPLKVFHLSNDDVIIEKIGSVYGFFRPYSITFEHTSLLCESYGVYADPPDHNVSYWRAEWPCVGGVEEASLQLDVYPNPFNTLLTVKSAETIDQIMLYDLQGRQVLSESAGHTQKELDVSELPEAMYNVVIVLEDQTELRRLCVKI